MSIPRSLLPLLFLTPLAGAQALPPSPWDVRTLAVPGMSGGMLIPDGRTVPEGGLVFGFSNYLSGEFAQYKRGDNYQFAIGLLPYVELSGRLANYPKRKEDETSFGDLGLRDLAANIKVALPRFIQGQPDIAFGINDVGGGAQYFRSRYLSVSDSFGPLKVTVGTSRGKPYLSRVFGGIEVALWSSGVSMLAERNDGAAHLGLRYLSRELGLLGHSRLALTVQSSFGDKNAAGASYDRVRATINLVTPIGRTSRMVTAPPSPDEPIWTPPLPLPAQAAPELRAAAQQAAAASDPAPESEVPSEALRDSLVRAGFENVRIGRSGKRLVVEYENHRYNRNEVDAIGIVLGAAASAAGSGIDSVSAVTRKAGLAVYSTTAPVQPYRDFLRDGDSYELRRDIQVDLRPDVSDVEWLSGAPTRHTWLRLKVEPILNKFVGTEVGVFDYSLAANLQAQVPLWRGAELIAHHVSTLDESRNVAHGIFGYAQQHNGIKAAVLSQSAWLGDSLHTTVNIGRLRYGEVGAQHETTLFLGRGEDALRLRQSYLVDRTPFAKQTRHTGSLTYRTAFPRWDGSVELSYNKYLGGDSGPGIQLERWFGDVAAQISVRRSEVETKLGFGLVFPLTPRQGMRPGYVTLAGPGNFLQRIETRYARPGQCNCIVPGVVEELQLVQSPRNAVFNYGRVGSGYIASELVRMREAFIRYYRGS